MTNEEQPQGPVSFDPTDPLTPPDRLTDLAQSLDPDIRAAVAGNPSTPPETLAVLVESVDYDVREAVAANTAAPPETLTVLAQDRIPWVRAAVAGNPSTPPQVWANLTKDIDPDVREAAAGNPYRYSNLTAAFPAVLESRPGLLDPLEEALVSLAAVTAGTVDVDAVRAQLKSGQVSLLLLAAKAQELVTAANTVHSAALAAAPALPEPVQESSRPPIPMPVSAPAVDAPGHTRS